MYGCDGVLCAGEDVDAEVGDAAGEGVDDGAGLVGVGVDLAAGFDVGGHAEAVEEGAEGVVIEVAEGGGEEAAVAAEPGGQPTFLPHELADLINDGLPPTWLAFASSAPEAAIAETLEAAQAVDRLIAGLPETAPVEAVLADRPALLDRSIHRLEHLEELQKVIAAHRGA